MASGLLGGLTHVRQARSGCLRRCPGVTVMILDRPPRRARGRHAARAARGGGHLGALVLAAIQRPTHYESVLVRCSRVQSLR